MDLTAVLALISKGLNVITALIAAGKSASVALAAILGLTNAAQSGEVTDEQLITVEDLLDQMIDEFNLDI